MEEDFSNKYCDRIPGSPTFSTLPEARKACSEISYCARISDYNCAHNEYWMCSGTIKPSSVGSCVWKHGMIFILNLH